MPVSVPCFTRGGGAKKRSGIPRRRTPRSRRSKLAAALGHPGALPPVGEGSPRSMLRTDDPEELDNCNSAFSVTHTVRKRVPRKYDPAEANWTMSLFLGRRTAVQVSRVYAPNEVAHSQQGRDGHG